MDQVLEYLSNVNIAAVAVDIGIRLTLVLLIYSHISLCPFFPFRLNIHVSVPHFSSLSFRPPPLT